MPGCYRAVSFEGGGDRTRTTNKFNMHTITHRVPVTRDPIDRPAKIPCIGPCMPRSIYYTRYTQYHTYIILLLASIGATARAAREYVGRIHLQKEMRGKKLTAIAAATVVRDKPPKRLSAGAPRHPSIGHHLKVEPDKDILRRESSAYALPSESIPMSRWN